MHLTNDKNLIKIGFLAKRCNLDGGISVYMVLLFMVIRGYWQRIFPNSQFICSLFQFNSGALN